MNSFLIESTNYIHLCGYIHSYVVLHLFISLDVSATYVLHSLIHASYSSTCFTHSCATLMRCIALILVLLFSSISQRCLIPLDQCSPLSRIKYTASYLLAHISFLTCIKSSVFLLLVKATPADGYKAPSFPHRCSLFNLVHIA